MAKIVFFMLSLFFSYAEASLGNDSYDKISLIKNVIPTANALTVAVAPNSNENFPPILLPPIAPPECVPPDYDFPKRIKLKLLTDQTALFTEQSRAKIYLYGYNKWGADAPATLLREYTEKISNMPWDFEFKFPNKDYKKIEYIPVECPVDAGYYLVLYIDINGDNKFCDGDFYQDYDIQEPHFFYGDNLANMLEFKTPMRSQIKGICRDF